MRFKFSDIFKKNVTPIVTLTVADTTDYSSNDNEFKFIFNDIGQADILGDLIAIGDSQKCTIFDSLTIYKNDKVLKKLNFKHQYHSTSKQKAIKFDRFIAVGLSGYFYLYDLSTSTVILFIDFNGYFVDFTIYDQHLLVTYNSGIYCLTRYGKIKWHNGNVGLDGVIISEIKEGKICGHEQIDPPEGWKDFVLDFQTGSRL